MSTDDVKQALASYFAEAGGKRRTTAQWAIPEALVEALNTLALHQKVPVEALVEFLLHKQLRAVQARLLVDEPLEPLPTSFVDPAVATAKAALTRQSELSKQLQDRKGDDSVRLVAEMATRIRELEAEVQQERENLARQRAIDEAKLEMALEESRGKGEPET